MSAEGLPRVLLVDLSGIFWRAWHSNGENEVSAARRRSREMIQNLVGGDFQGTLVAICCDRGRSFRKDVDENYKAQRPAKDMQVVGELRELEAELTADGHLLWGADGFEADDVIATATVEAVRRGHEVVVASADKDLLQLLAIDGVSVRRVHTGQTWTNEIVAREFGVPAYLIGDWLALVGDTSDNIRGVPSIGAKTATKLLTAFPGLGFLLDAAESGATGVTPREARALSQNRADVELARRLIELRRDVALDFDQIYADPALRRPTINRKEIDMTIGDPRLNEAAQLPLGAPASAAPAPAVPPPAAAAPPAPAAPAVTATTTVVAAKTDSALAPVVQAELVGPFEMGLEPVNLSVAWALADILWESRLYSKFPNKAALLAVIGRGRELGFGAFASLDMFHFFESKLAPHATLIRALAERDPNCEWITPITVNAEGAKWRAKHRRHKEHFEHTYTIQEAVDAGLCELALKPRDWTVDPKTGKVVVDHRGNWDKRRTEMLSKTCCSQLVGMIFPNAKLGLYSLEELDAGDPS